MRTYRIRITMDDGSFGEHYGIYRDSFSATVRALQLFPQARSVSAISLARLRQRARRPAARGAS